MSSTAPLHNGTAGDLCLQRLTLPDPEITDQTALFVRLAGGADVVQDRVTLPAGSAAGFDTYVNFFDLAHWHKHCHLDGLWLHLRGTGQICLSLRDAARPDTPALTRTLGLTPEGIVIDLRTCLATPDSLLSLHLEAVDAACLEGGAWLTRPPENTPAPVLAIVITTFRREAEVTRTAARIAQFLDQTGTGEVTHLFVIDNANSAALPPHDHLTVLPNRNLGGAGGFARGLAAAQDGGFSHVLFMDDDAAFQMENLLRTRAFLHLARDPAAAVAGAMISAGRPHVMWENGAVFDRFCRPCDHGTDLRDAGEVAAMLHGAPDKPASFYGGWWFFACPLSHVVHYPFPFFVRGDDISFSLAHDFACTTLNGVMSFQEDFAVKESPQTLYLDLRNHLHHHLVHPALDIGPRATAWLAVRFILRSLVRMHYDSATAQLLAWSDVMAGPDFFAHNADMTTRRATVAALTDTETWVPCDPQTHSDPAPATPPSRLYAYAMKLTMNGHLLPGFGWFGRKVVLGTRDRAPLWPLWGARSVRYVDSSNCRTYEVHHDKARFFSLLWQTAKHAWRWNRAYKDLSQAHREAYPRLASRAFWDTQFTAISDAGPAP